MQISERFAETGVQLLNRIFATYQAGIHEL